MGIADLFIPGQRRRKLGLSIEGVVGVARSRAEAEGLDASRVRLWNMLCVASGQTLQQLLVKNDDRRLDWGLKKHAKRVSDPVLIVLFWWMMIYQIVLFKNRGLEGYDPEEDVEPMYEFARQFVETEFARMEVEADAPGPWSENWRRQYPIESAMEFYNSTYSMLNLANNLTLRIEHVSHFATLTEQAYDRLAAESVFEE